MTGAPRDPSGVDLLVDRILELRREGVPVDVERLARTRPEVAASLRRVLPAVELLDAAGAEETAEAAAPPPGLDAVGDVELVREIGRGGMGVVYEGRDRRTGRRVAVKVLGASLLAREASRERFRREAALAARLDAPGLCPALEVGESQGHPYIVMEYVEGESLAERIRRWNAGEDGADRTARVLEWVESAARTLHVAHEAGVVHRDVKPGNLMVRDDAPPVVLDFGLARDLEADEPTLTGTGDLHGTPLYMAPEQIDPRFGTPSRLTDVYALGVTLFEGLTGEKPFDEATRERLFKRVLEDPPRDVLRLAPSLPRDVRVVVETALAKDPRHRYRSAAALADDLRRLREGRPVRARRASAPARAWRWARRRPVAAALVATLAVTLPAIASLATHLVRTADERRAGHAAALTRRSHERLEQTLGHPGERTVDERIALHREALELDGGNAIALAGLAAALIEAGRPAEALARLEEQGGAMEPLRVLSGLRRRALERLGRPVDAPGEPPPIRAAADWFFLANEEIARGDAGEEGAYARAFRAFTEAALAAGSPRPLFHYGRVWAAGLTGDEERVDRATRALLLHAPESGRSRYWIGRASFQLGRVDAAVEELTAAARLMPDVPRVRVYLSEALLAAGLVERAIEEAAAAVALDERFALGHVSLGSALERSGDPERALESYLRATALRPGFFVHHLRCANALILSGRHEEAHAAIDRSLAAGGAADAARECRGIVLAAEGRFEDALVVFEELAAEHPDRAQYRSHLGLILAQTGDVDGALEALEEGVRLAPEEGAVRYSLGYLQLEAGRIDEAVETLEAALALAPNDLDVVELLARALLRRGDVSRAREVLTEAKGRFEGSASAAARIEELLERCQG